MILRIIWLLVSVLSFPSFLNAAQHKRLTLDDAIKTALQQNRSKKISAIDLRLAQEYYQEALSANLPVLDIEFNYIQRDEEVISVTNGEVNLPKNVSDMIKATNGTYISPEALQSDSIKIPLSYESVVYGDRMTEAALVLRYTLYSGGKISALQEEARIGKTLAAEAYEGTKDEVVLEVKKYYYGALLTESVASLVYDISERLSVLEELTKDLFEKGSEKVSRRDYYRVQLASAMFNVTNQKLQTKVQQAKSALLLVMGEDIQTEVNLKNVVGRKVDYTKKSLPALTELVLAHNHQLKGLDALLKLHTEKIKEAKSDFKPSVGVIGKVEHLDANYDGGLNNSQNNNSWSVGVHANWNLYHGGKTLSKVEQAKLKLLQIKERREKMVQMLKFRVKKAYLNLKECMHELPMLEKTIGVAQKNSSLNTRAYYEGMVPTKDVVEALLYEARIKMKYYQLQQLERNANAMLDYLLGR